MKQSFILYADAYECIRSLTTHQKGQLLDAIFVYHRGEEPTEMDDVTAMAFAFLRQTFDRDSSKYLEKCGKARAAAKMRWDANACERIKRNAFDADNDTDTDTESDKNIPATSETAVSSSAGTAEEENKNDSFLSQTKNLRRKPKSDRPNQCPPETWAHYLKLSRGFHLDKQNQLGKMAPCTETKVLDGAKALDNLIRVRGFPEQDVIAVLGWSIEDQFWSTNLRSIASLLKKSGNGDIKYVNVFASMNRDIDRRVDRGMSTNG